jgi:hypothetical protein
MHVPGRRTTRLSGSGCPPARRRMIATLAMRYLTREHALWLCIATVAALTRFAHLGLPMSDVEARMALDALSVARGQEATLLNPLFGFLQSTLLLLFGDADAAARFFAALSGLALCLLPLLLRGTIGRARALVMGVVLALSPTLMFVSRQAIGDSLAWTLAAALIWSQTRDATAPRLRGSILAGLLLANGIDAITPALTTVLVLLLSGQVRVLPALASSRRAAIAVGLSFAVGATGFFVRPLGVADVFNGWAAWAQGWATAPLLTSSRLMLGFLVAELFVIVFGLTGLAMIGLNRGLADNPDNGDTLLHASAWLAGGLLMTALYPGRAPGDITPIVIGAAYLASIPLATLVAGFSRSTWTAWSIAAVVFVLLQFVSVGLRQFASQQQSAFLTPIAVAFVLVAGLLGASALNGDLGSGLRGLGVALGAALLLYAAGTGIQLTQQRWNNPAEPYVVAAPSDELVSLVNTMQTSAIRATGEPDGVPVLIDTMAPPSLRWALRGQTRAQYGADIGALNAAILPATTKPAGTRGFIGSSFVIARSGDLSQARCNQVGETLDCAPLARWLLFRELSAGSVTAQNWALWLSTDLAAQVSGQQ